MPGRSTTDQIYVNRQILEKTIEFNIDTYHLFIDFKGAYDSVLRDNQYKAMYRLAIPYKIIRLVNAKMHSVICKVQIQGKLSDQKFKTEVGSRQGDALACLLVKSALETAVRETLVDQKGSISSRPKY